jgi:hypothetical protein
MRYALIALFVLVLLGCSKSEIAAQCSKCIESSDCAVRTTGPLQKEEIKEASKLLEVLSAAKKSLVDYQAVPDSSDISFSYYVKNDRCGSGISYNRDCYESVYLGNAGDVRDLVNVTLKTKIKQTSCRLRAIGVDVPQP